MLGVKVSKSFLKMPYDFVIRDRDMGRNVQVKNERTEYIEKASFALEMLQHIDAGAQSGFIVRVKCSLREETS